MKEQYDIVKYFGNEKIGSSIKTDCKVGEIFRMWSGHYKLVEIDNDKKIYYVEEV